MPKSSCNTIKEVVNHHYESQWEGYTEKDVLYRVKNLANVIDPIISGLPMISHARVLDIGSGRLVA